MEYIADDLLNKAEDKSLFLIVNQLAAEEEAKYIHLLVRDGI